MKYGVGDKVMIANEYVLATNAYTKSANLSLNDVYTIIESYMDTHIHNGYLYCLNYANHIWFKEEDLISLTELRINKINKLLNINNS